MYLTKTVNQDADFILLNQCRWLIEKTAGFRKLEISRRAELTVPEGKVLTLTVNGVVRDALPAVYTGDVRLNVTDGYLMEPHGLMKINQIKRYMRQALCIEDGEVKEEKSVTAAIAAGEYDGKTAKKLYIAGEAECVNGIIIDGDSEYTIENCKMDIDGFL